MNQFSVIETIKTTWEKTQGAKQTILTAVGINIVINLLLELIEYLMSHEVIFIIFAFIIINLLTMGIILIGTRRAPDLPIKYTMMFDTFAPKFGLRILLTMILFSFILLIPSVLLVFSLFSQQPRNIITALSCLLFICFVLYLMIRLSLTFRIALMQKISPWQAVKLSFQSTKNHFWQLLALVFLNILILTVGIIPFGIGLIWAIPYYVICFGVVYESLVLKEAVKAS